MNLPPPILAPQGICGVTSCRPACALEAVDSLLRAAGAVRGEEVDALLDFRSLLRHRQDAEAVLSLFCQLRRAMEERHYLTFYRLRRWLENHIQVLVLSSGDFEQETALKLDRYCIEAVRSHCLQSVLKPGEPLLAPKVQFLFRSMAQPVASSYPGCSGG